MQARVDADPGDAEAAAWLAAPANVPDFQAFGLLAGQKTEEAAANGMEIYSLYAAAFAEMSQNVALGNLMNKIRPRL